MKRSRPYTVLSAGWRLLLPLLLFQEVSATVREIEVSADIVVFEATPGGILAAIAAARTLRNHTANFISNTNNDAPRILLISTKPHIGGMCTNGLSKTDVGNFPIAIGGLAREFFTRNGARYNESQNQPLFNLEPHVAEEIFWEMLQEQQPLVRVLLSMELESVDLNPSSNQIQFQSILLSNYSHCSNATTKVNNKCDVVAAAPENKIRVTGRMFVDASYEGDLYGRSYSVPFAMGRESSRQYREDLAGRRPMAQGNQINAAVNPRWDNGTLIPLVTSEFDNLPIGSGDAKMQACSFRLCLTKNKTNGVPWLDTPPTNYHADTYELARRYAEALRKHGELNLRTFLGNVASTVRDKYDCNNGGGVSLDFLGACQEWPMAGRDLRNRIYQRHVEYTRGLLYFLRTDLTLPVELRNEVHAFYLCKDEWVNNDHWPRELYIREARRLIGEMVYTQNSLAQNWTNSIGLGGYGVDSHNVQRIPVVIKGVEQVKNEGDVQIKTYGVHEIPFQALLPKRDECSNLIVPVALSASHVGFSALRLEPTWMVLGHAAGTAAALCIQNEVPPHNLDVVELQRILMDQGQIIRRHGVPDSHEDETLTGDDGGTVLFL